MSTVRGIFYDGLTWDRQDVQVRFDRNGGIRIAGDGIDLALKFDDVSVSDRLADIPRYLYLSGGDACELLDNDAVDSWLAQSNAQRGSRFLHRLDTSVSAAMAAIAVIGLILVLFVLWGAPALAERAVEALPMEVDQTIGDESLAVLDNVAFSPSTVAESRQAEIRAAFDEMVSDMETPMGGHLVFRRSEILGANAFALAGNTVILTDELIELAEHDEEIIAVLAHEMGHIQHRHVMKHVARSAIVAVLVAAYIGDVTAITGVAATMPAVLDSMRHSRAFEREADRVARDYLDSVGIAPSRLGDLLARLMAQCPECEEIPHYLSTHPPLDERVEALTGNDG
ncbi:MAG: M48 family metallopeptidase [Gammaproteobacteria bacterium]|nr:M48 family metallopeptidase [Gammaproteobacteria bacterium]